MNKKHFFLALVILGVFSFIIIKYIDLGNKLANYKKDIVGSYSNAPQFKDKGYIEFDRYNKEPLHFSFDPGYNYSIYKASKFIDEGTYSKISEYVFELKSKSGKTYNVVKGIVDDIEGIYYYDEDLKAIIALRRVSDVAIGFEIDDGE